MIMMGVRKALDWVFTKNEMKILDDILPEHKRTERLDDDAEHEEDKTLPGAAPGVGPEDTRGDGGEGGNLGAGDRKSKYAQEIPLANGCVVKIPSAGDLPDINISEEVNKSGVWKSLEANTNSNSSGSIKKEDVENIAKRYIKFFFCFTFFLTLQQCTYPGLDFRRRLIFVLSTRNS